MPSQPVFSFDGRWLAYLEQQQGPATGDDYSRLWIAHADGSDAHVVPGLKVYSLIGWSPASDALAVAAGPERTKQPCPCYSPTTLRIVSADGSYRTVARTSWLYGGSWSPDGTKLVIAADRYPHSTSAVYSASGGRGTTWLRMNNHQRLNDMNGVLLQIAGWWPHVGIGFWVFGDGAVHNNDATPLDLITASGARPRLLGQTLSDGTTDAVAASSSGDVAIVTDHGGGRAAAARIRRSDARSSLGAGWEDARLRRGAECAHRSLVAAGDRRLVCRPPCPPLRRIDQTYSTASSRSRRHGDHLGAQRTQPPLRPRRRALAASDP